MPYAADQPMTGHFWCKVEEKVRGSVPVVRVSYTPLVCGHCDDAPCAAAAKDGAVYRHDDGLVVIDPAKAKGQKQIVDACPYHAIYWNDELQIPQKCTGCAHLLDGDEPISIPVASTTATSMLSLSAMKPISTSREPKCCTPNGRRKPRVFYRGLPKKFVAGTVYDPVAKDVVIGAKVKAEGESGSFEAETDDWGDFWLRDLPDGDWTIAIEADGKKKVLETSTREKDVGLGDIALA